MSVAVFRLCKNPKNILHGWKGRGVTWLGRCFNRLAYTNCPQLRYQTLPLLGPERLDYKPKLQFPLWPLLTQFRLKHGGKKGKSAKAGKGGRQDKKGSADGEDDASVDLDDIANIEDTKRRYGRVLEALKHDFQGLRGGKADPGMLDHLKVDMYGSSSNLSEAAQVSMKGPQLMVLTVYDPGMTEAVAEAVRYCDMGLNPSVDGETLVTVPIPKTTKESRDAVVKVAAKHTEKTKVVIRGIRHKVVDKVKKKKDQFPSDDVHIRLKEIDQLTQQSEGEASKMLEKKKTEILTV